MKPLEFVRKHRWAAGAACLLLPAAGIGLLRFWPALSLLWQPATQNSYFQVERVRASFDQETWEGVFTVTARSDYALDQEAPAGSREWFCSAHVSGQDQGGAAYALEFAFPASQEIAWEKIWRDTYRCQLRGALDAQAQGEVQAQGALNGTLQLNFFQRDSRGNIQGAYPGSGDFLLKVPPLEKLAPPAPGTWLEAEEPQVETTAIQAGGYYFDVTAYAATDLELDHPLSDSYYQWEYAAVIGEEQVPLENRTGSERMFPHTGEETLAWSPAGEGRYQSRQLEFYLSEDAQRLHQLWGETGAVLTLTCREATGEEPREWVLKVPFSVELAEKPEPPAPATSLAPGGEAAAACQEGVLRLTALVETDMELDRANAWEYYHWSAQATLTAPDGRQVSFPSMGSAPVWEKALDTGTLPRYRTAGEDVSGEWQGFAFALTNEGRDGPDYQEEYGLWGELSGTLTLTCRETAGSGEKDWTVTMPFSVELHRPPAAQPLEVTATRAAFDSSEWALTLDLAAHTQLPLDTSLLEERFDWDYTLVLQGPEGEVEFPFREGSDLALLDCWENTGQGTYQISGLTVGLDPALQGEQGIRGMTSGSLRMAVTDRRTHQTYEGQAAFSVDIPPAEALEEPPAGSYLSHGDVNAHSCEPGAGLLTYMVVLRTDLDLDHPLAKSYYQGSAALEVTGLGGEACSLPVGRASPDWESLSHDTYQTLLPFTFLVPEGAVEEFALYGECPAVLTVTFTDERLDAPLTLEIHTQADFPMPEAGAPSPAAGQP